MREVKFQTSEYYHIYNRGVDKREIFMDKKDYIRFLTGMREFNNTSAFEQRLFVKNRKDGINKELSSKALELSSFLNTLPKLVEIVCYCLIPNHFHLILKQLIEDGIKVFMHKLGTGYTNYFNQRYNRSGSLFQGTFKAIRVKDYGHLLKLLVYVNCNYEIHGLGKSKNWIWSSYLDSIGKRNGTLCNLNIIIEEFKLDDFKLFCNDIIPEIKINKNLQKYFLE